MSAEVVIAPIALQCRGMESRTDVLFVVVFFFFLFLYNYCTARNIHQKETFNDLYHRFFCDAQKTPRWIIILPNQLVSDQISHIFGSLRIIISVLLQHPVINLIINFFFLKNPAGSSYGRIYSLHLTVIRF